MMVGTTHLENMWEKESKRINGGLTEDKKE